MSSLTHVNLLHNFIFIESCKILFIKCIKKVIGKTSRVEKKISIEYGENVIYRPYLIRITVFLNTICFHIKYNSVIFVACCE